MVSFEEFKKLDLRIRKIMEVEKVEGAEKLLKLKVDLGNEFRQIVAGIAQFYKAEDLVGKEIVVVVNLEPRVLFGLESQGMLLAADMEGRAVILKPDEQVPTGTKVR